jgi:hypothetical protein
MAGGIQGYQFLGPDNKDQNTQQGGTQTTAFNFDPTAKLALDKSLSSTDYSKDSAIADAKGAANYAITQTLQQSVPGITSSDKVAGGYNNTTTGMLENDANAKAAAAGQGVLLQNIRSYADARAATVNSNTAAVAATSGKTSTSELGTVAQDRSAGALWDVTHPNNVAGGRYKGGGGQGSGGNTVICSQLTLDRHISLKVYRADNLYVYHNFSEATKNGYHFWAVPFVRLMRRNKVAYAIGKWIGVHWSMHCASYYTKEGKWNITGYLLIKCLTPVCWLLGQFVAPTRWESLWVSSN